MYIGLTMLRPGNMFRKSFRCGGLLRNCRPKSTKVDAAEKSISAQDVARNLIPGTKLHGYTVEKVVEVPELFLTTVTLKHDKTEAKHVHVAKDDDNNTFSVLFKTTPTDSTGVSHILEHTVLCGSHKFPVRDPFFKMINRSLATFMNAMTASDWTMYPFSTQNRKDYDNLLSIYMDAVFYPQLRELDFRQEGWRLEHEDLQNRNSCISFKGVVYNEMKGVFSSQQNIFAEAVQNHLLPSHTYGVVSGGDPDCIPYLTWEQLKKFHKTHYHPSNSRFFTYGNFPLEDQLQFINENYLKQFGKIDPGTEVPSEPRWKSPKEVIITCQPDKMAPDSTKQTTVAVSYLLSDITDIEEATCLSIISALLTEGETSPFYQSLLEANIGSSYSPVIGYNGYTKDSSFSIGLQGIHPDDVEMVKKIITETVDKVISEGFEKSRIEALLHRIELGTKHQSNNFGLKLIMSIASGWNHDCDAAEMLKVNHQIQRFKQKLELDPHYLQKKVQHYLKDNSHKLTLVMNPDEEFEEKRKKKEDRNLKGCIDKLCDVEREMVFSLGQQLQETQSRDEDLSCLPCIRLDEIDKSVKKEHVEHTQFDGVSIQFSVQPTNEVSYVKMVSFLDQVPEELKIYVPLFSRVITKMGAGAYDFKQLSHQAELYTGGLDSTTHIRADPLHLFSFDQGVLLSSHCLERNLDKMLALWTEIFNRADLHDSRHLQTLIRMTAAELAADVSNSGHIYAMRHSASCLTPSGKLEELFMGFTQVTLMKKIAEQDDNSEVMEHLIELCQQILNKDNLKISINAAPDFMHKALEKLEKFVETLHRSRITKQTGPKCHTVNSFVAESKKTHIVLPFLVNYMSKSVQIVPYTHQHFSSFRVMSKLLSWKYLHREIREKGGAYGAGASCDNGILSFFSYRDPNSLQSIEVFDKSIDWICNGHFTDTDVDEAKITVFQQIDKPVAPSSCGDTLFLSNISDEMRQKARDELFKVKRDNLVEVAQKYLLPRKQPSSLCLVGPENEAIVKNNDWNIIMD